MPQVSLQSPERRDKLRLPFKRLIQMKPVTGCEQYRLEGVDYSPGGLAVSSNQPLPVGTRVQLRFAVGRNRQTEMEIEGEIIHYRMRGERYLLGICFLEPTLVPDSLPA